MVLRRERWYLLLLQAGKLSHWAEKVSQKASGWKSLETCHEPSLFMKPRYVAATWLDTGDKLMLMEGLLPQPMACPVPHMEI